MLTATIGSSGMEIASGIEVVSGIYGCSSCKLCSFESSLMRSIMKTSESFKLAMLALVFTGDTGAVDSFSVLIGSVLSLIG